MPYEEDDRLDNMEHASAAFTLIRHTLEQLAKDVRELRSEVSELRKPKYNLLVSFSGVVIATVIGLWGLAISPIKEELPSFAKKEVVDTQLKGYLTREAFDKWVMDVNRGSVKK